MYNNLIINLYKIQFTKYKIIILQQNNQDRFR